ncbi:Tuberin, partial [Stegodyphus mimosarum]
MTVMRTYLFKILATHNILEDTLPRLEMLKALSEDGKIVSNFEEEIGPFLLSWFPEIMGTGKTAEFLRLITNVIKFNAAYLDDEIIAGFIKSTCDLCTRTKAEEDIQESLNVLDAVLCYSHLPSYVLQCFISTLCLTVNVEKFSQCSWK